MSGIKQLFTPSGRKFYQLFEEVAANLEEMSRLFFNGTSIRDKAGFKPTYEAVKQLEHENDIATHKLFVELGRNFITPFDREDIHYMATALDDVADNIWAVVKQMYFYDTWQHADATKEVAEHTVAFTASLSKAIHGLRNARELHAVHRICNVMRERTAACDNIISSTVFEAERTETDAIEVLKITEHYNKLEGLVNKSAEVINVLESMVIKYG